LRERVTDEEFYRQQYVERYVDLDCPENGVNLWLPGAARRLLKHGCSAQRMFELLYPATRSVKHRVVGDDEIWRAIEFVLGTPGLRINGPGPHAEKPKFELAYLQSAAALTKEDVDPPYLEARSQFTCWNRTPAGFLHKLYQPGAQIWIVTKYKTRHGEIWTHNGLNQRFDELDHLLKGHFGVWFLTAPIDGCLHAADRIKSKWNQEGYSFTILESLVAWAYLLIETDVAPIPLWRKAVVQWPLPIVAIYESGGDGDHILLRINAQSKEDFDHKAGQYDRDLIRLGACPGSVTARRLSRLPNCMRGQTGRLQRLLYLRPDADNTPICQIPPRSWTPGLIHNYESPDL
jgi:hypothetical protein